MSQQKSVASLLSYERIQKLARPSDVQRGRAIHGHDGVEYITNTSQHVEAWVGGLDGSAADGGAQRRRTNLSVMHDELQWSCTCRLKDRLFCKHCVALALAALKGSP